ncbi:MAG: FecR domain-containing protein [Pseudomonadota bacterium]|uniref:FecR family protein n=1 Tax=Sphingomonas sp. ERG5 TaxID=1381597 RepID=UPI00068C4AD1|nr:FecR domain-containing protein [Sphingomonas sp. ERG5]
MSGSNIAPRSGDAVAAEAALWVVRTAGPRLSGQRDPGFERWLVEHPSHRSAFVEASALWRDFGVAVAGDRAGARATPARRWSWPKLTPAYGWSAALAVCLLLFIGVQRHFAASPVYMTAVGEQRSIRLSDESRAVLNTDTRLEVEYTDADRRVILDRGEALFEVAHNPDRPFYVEAGDDYVRAVGTSFTVRRDPSGVEVTLLTGKVIVGKIAAAAGAPHLTLRPGDRLKLNGAGAAPIIDRPVIDNVTAWRRGELVFDATPVPAAIAEMNRYSNRRIVLRDGADVARARLSGVFDIGENENFAKTLAAIYGLKAAKTTDGFVISGQSAASPAR